MSCHFLGELQLWNAFMNETECLAVFSVSREQKTIYSNTEVADLGELPAIKKANLCHCSLIQIDLVPVSALELCMEAESVL